MASQKHLLISFLSFLLLTLRGEPPLMAAKEVIPVGVVLDLNSPVGRVAEHCMSMALSDFYAANHHYNTRLSLFTKDSGNDVIGAASAALELMKNDEVQAIIGPQSSAQARFVIELGRKAQVPILSFTATSPSLSPVQNPFFIRTAQDDSAQVKAIAAIVQAYGWREIVLIYEDTDYGNGLIPYLMDAFLKIDTRVPYRSVIPPSSNNSEITKEISKLKEDHTKIFLVHMTAALGSKLFVLANNAGMLSKGYAWIFTEGLSDLEDRMGSKVKDLMQGVMGLRPYIPSSKHFEDFKRRLKRNLTSSKPNIKITGYLFGLWAYDTVFALAMAVEKAGIVHSKFLKQNSSQSNVDLEALGISEIGPTLRDAILSTKFQGLRGRFQLVKGQLEPSAFEILNVIGKTERIIGYWTRQRGLSQELDDNNEVAYSISKDKLKQPIWPGDTTEQPPKLRIGVPVKQGFDEFLKVEWDPRTDKPIISGFSHDVFIAVLKALPFTLNFEYIPFMNKDRQSAGTIDELIYQINLQNYDAVVGATTIVANRSLYVDFTLPYSEAGVSMVVVMMKDDEKNKFWIFLKPLSLDLWVTTCAAFVFTGLVIWVLEHRINREFRGPPDQQLGIIFWFSFSTLVFAHSKYLQPYIKICFFSSQFNMLKLVHVSIDNSLMEPGEKLVSNWSRLVMIVWIFLVLILTQSYTASLASMLTVQRLQPTFVDIKEIKKNGYFVGYQKNSYVEGLLIKQLNFDRSKLKPFSTHEEYHEALSKGTQNGGVAAVFDEIPYIKFFLARYCSRYTMVGPTYKSDGYGFAFPRGSPLVPYISRAILNVTQDRDKMGAIEQTYFSSRGSTNCEDPSASISSNSPSLSLHSFGGLFIITGTVSLISLLVCFFKFVGSHWPTLSNNNPESSFLSKLIEMAKHFDQRDPSSHLLERNTSMAHPIAGPKVIEPSTCALQRGDPQIKSSNVLYYQCCRIEGKFGHLVIHWASQAPYRRLSSCACRSCIDAILMMLTISSAEYSAFSKVCTCPWASTMFVMHRFG